MGFSKKLPFLFAVLSAALSASGNASVSFTKFSTSLAKQIGNTNQNTVLSPFSISDVMAMVAVGAKGATNQQIVSVLGLQGDFKSGYRQIIQSLNNEGSIQIANRLWLQSGFQINKNYSADLSNYFISPLSQLNFRSHPEISTLLINGWTALKTRGQIMALIPPGAISSRTRLVLTNAIHFKARWQHAFEKYEDTTEPFYFASGKGSQLTRFMNATYNYVYADDSTAQIVQLPYKDGQFALVVYLPRPTVSLAALENQTLIDRGLSMTKGELVAITFPLFKIDSSFELVPNLKAVGITDAFSNNADFSGICSDPCAHRLKVSNVIHKAYIKVNEKGTEAAAATAAVFAPATMAPIVSQTKPIVFKANRPFLFVIEHVPTHSIIMMGQVYKP